MQGKDEKPIVLVVDDQLGSFRSLGRLISPDAFEVVLATDDRDGLKVLEKKGNKVRIVIIDLKSSEIGGGGFFHHARSLAPSAAVLITGPLGPFLYQGGNFYECPGLGLKNSINEILAGIDRKIGNGRKAEKKKGKNRQSKERFGAIIGRSNGINEIYRLIEKLKNSSITILIQGESGTGKELVAQTIHQTSSRGNRPFVPVNCGAIPASLMESELFGHERGAFTSAVNLRRGKFELADGGTLFLDEIGEMEKETQVKLLRVLQEKEIQRVGGNRAHPVDVRIIAATSRDLKQEVRSGYFRDDLFFRLNVVPIHIPPLRSRREDIPLLVAHFFEKIAGRMGKLPPILEKSAEKALVDYDYPGNVRELINIVERIVVLGPEGLVSLGDLPDEVLSDGSGAFESSAMLKEVPAGGVRIGEIEKELILKTLKAAGDNKAKAARWLGITRRKLYLRLSSYGCVEDVRN